MIGRILVLGAAGRFGHMAAERFREGGWTVVSLVRPGTAARALPGTEIVEADARNRAAVAAAARGADIVLHALNPPYTEWHQVALPLAYAAIEAAETAGATLMLPGNLYNYGSGMPELIDESTLMRPTARKGLLRVLIEQRMHEATERGMRAVILRAGDFYGAGRGSWFDLVIAKDARSGIVTYPGPLDVVHEWVYLPDLATAMVRLAARRDALAPFETIGCPGHAVTGRELADAIGKAMGREMRVKRMPWWLVHATAPIYPMSRELSEIAYLWKRPHRIVGDKLRAVIGDVPHTPFGRAVRAALDDLGMRT